MMIPLLRVLGMVLLGAGAAGAVAVALSPKARDFLASLVRGSGIPGEKFLMYFICFMDDARSMMRTRIVRKSAPQVTVKEEVLSTEQLSRYGISAPSENGQLLAEFSAK